jgi:hypothetical protein
MERTVDPPSFLLEPAFQAEELFDTVGQRFC